eukprot:COSAG01_NODE_33006_length_571_cov_2.855932_1_plen_66_part_00
MLMLAAIALSHDDRAAYIDYGFAELPAYRCLAAWWLARLGFRLAAAAGQFMVCGSSPDFWLSLLQ